MDPPFDGISISGFHFHVIGKTVPFFCHFIFSVNTSSRESIYNIGIFSIVVLLHSHRGCTLLITLDTLPYPFCKCTTVFLETE